MKNLIKKCTKICTKNSLKIYKKNIYIKKRVEKKYKNTEMPPFPPRGERGKIGVFLGGCLKTLIFTLFCEIYEKTRKICNNFTLKYLH